MPLPVILGAAKGALAVAKAAKAAKALKAAKSMKAAGTAAKGAKAAKASGAPKKLMTEGFNNVGSKANLKASKEKLKTAKKQERLQKGADRLVKRDERRTEMKKNMEARAKQQEQQSSGESKKKKESIKELYDKSREGLERKDRRSAAMSNFATKGTMKHGGKYKKGGRKPGALQDKIAKAASNRSSNQKFKSEINKLRADRMSEKAAATKNKAVKAIREEVAAKRGDQSRGQAAKAERATKVSKFASKRGDMARNRAKNKAAKAEIRSKYGKGGRKEGKVKGLLSGLEAMPSKNAGRAKKKLPKNMSEMPGYDFQATSKLFKDNVRKIGSQANKAMEKATGLKGGKKYENGGKFSKSKRPKKMEKMMKYNRVGAPGDKKTKEMLKRVTKGSVGDMELRYTTGKSAAQLFDAIDKSHQVPNKALAKKTEDFGREGKKTYYEGNPGGLKGKTKGKGGNVGAGVKVKKKRRR